MEGPWITVATLSRVSVPHRPELIWLITLDTRLLWENVLDTQNDYKFPTQYANLTKVHFIEYLYTPGVKNIILTKCCSGSRSTLRKRRCIVARLYQQVVLHVWWRVR